MTTNKERIAELERRVAELEKKLSGYWLLDKNSPGLVTFPDNGAARNITSWTKCPNCGGSYPPGQHNACWYYNPGNVPFTLFGG
jgi:hypothetical protein